MYITRRNFLKATAAAAVVLPTMGAGALGKVAEADKYIKPEYRKPWGFPSV